MRVLKFLTRKLIGVMLLALLLLGGVAKADMVDTLQQGEEVVVLTVENMT